MRRTEKAERDRELAARLGAATRRLREKRGLSLEELARRAALDKGQLGKVERGEGGTSVGGWLDIARALGLTLGEFLTYAMKR
jgi:transcriptional regulator with XRE-family HTH domain